MARATQSFRRKAPSFQPQPRVLILCEDTKSSLFYLQDAARHFRSYAEVEIANIGKTDPLSIVEEAIKKQRVFESIYCVIDRDQHEGFDAALALAHGHTQKITVIASYTCYEFWLLLHFCKKTKPYISAGNKSSGELLLKDLRAYDEMREYAKGNDTADIFDKLLLRLPDARKRSAQVMAEMVQINSLNPSTRLHDLIELLEKLGQPQLLT